MTAYNNNNDENVSTVRIKTVVLLILCCQNAGHALLTRYSQGVLKESYSSTEVVLVGEFIKIIFSAYCVLTEKAGGGSGDVLLTSNLSKQQQLLTSTYDIRAGFRRLGTLTVNSKHVIVLVILYSITNIASYYALARVEAAVYTVLLQLKIFTTAAFAVVMLGRTISLTKWRALLLLVLGCILVASPTFNSSDCDSLFNEPNRFRRFLSQQYDSYSSLFFTYNIADINAGDISSGGRRSLANAIVSSASDSVAYQTSSLLGIGAILVMVVFSGYSAIYFEGMLKHVGGNNLTIWERNYQLAFYSILLLLVIMCIERNYYGGDSYDFFEGWTIHTVMIALVQAGGGLLVAATLKYADAILKTLATSGAIVLSTLLGHFLLGGTMDIFVVIGCISTMLAIFNYTFDSSP